MSFIRHEACPKCRERGKDKAGDNLGVYENGAFCYACGHREVRHDSEKPPNEESKVRTIKELSIYTMSNVLPPAYLSYLRQFKLREYYIQKYFRYCEEIKRMVFVGPGAEYLEARSLYQQPKTLFYGKKAPSTWGSPSGSTIVIVEDIISAFKIAEFTQSIALFGSSVPENFWSILYKLKKPVIFWLDSDKLAESKKFRDKARATGLPSTLIYTQKDPKWLPNVEIQVRLLEAAKKLGQVLIVQTPQNGGTVSRWDPHSSQMVMVPAESVRAALWRLTRPEYISDAMMMGKGLKQGIRFLADSGNVFYATAGTGNYKMLPVQPPGYPPEATAWNNEDIYAEIYGTYGGASVPMAPPAPGSYSYEAAVNYFAGTQNGQN